MSVKIKLLFIFFTISNFLITGFGQPNIPKQNIPQDISLDLRKNIEKLYSSDTLERGNAIIEIGYMGLDGLAAIPFLIEMFNDHTSLVWKVGIADNLPTSPSQLAESAFKDMGKSALMPLIFALRDDRVFVRSGAATALGYLDDTTAVAPLISVLNDSGLVLEGAAWSLGVLGQQIAVDPLLKVLDARKHEKYIWSAIYALGLLGGQKAIESLINLIGDKVVSENAQATILDSLKMLTNKDFGFHKEKWIEWWSQNKGLFYN